MKTWQRALLFLTVGVFVGIIGFAGFFLAARRPAGRPVALLPAPTSAPIQVEVSGEVARPGLYALPRGSRVQDALAAAGGFRDGADRAALNLAARLQDGEKIVVFAPGVPRPTAVAISGAASGSGGPSGQGEVSFPVDLNSATLEALDALPGIGPERAKEILRYREAHGGFRSVEELKEVGGIGEVTFEKLKDKVTVAPES